MNDPILFFDGVCALCNGLVRFLIDRESTLRFAPIQGSTAVAILDEEMRAQLSSLIVRTQNGELLRNSAAIFYIAARMRFPWRVIAWGRVLPRVFTDVLYRLVARSRYSLFGRYDQCRLPAAGERARFLD